MHSVVTYLVGIFDNDYNSLVKYVTVNSDSNEKVENWCTQESWSGHTYMIVDTYDFALKMPDKII